MEIEIEDFDIKPVLCPANLAFPNCSACRFAIAYVVRNPPVSGAFTNFGSVQCNYIETMTTQIEKLKDKTNQKAEIQKRIADL